MRAPDVVLHFAYVWRMAKILQFRHVCFCTAVVLVWIHRAINSFSWHALPTGCCQHRWVSWSVEVILQFLVPCLLINIGRSLPCFDLVWRILVVHFLKRIFVEVDRSSIPLRRYLLIWQLGLLLQVQHAHLLRRHKFFYAMGLPDLKLV